MMNKSVRAGLLIAACLCISAVSFANMTVPALECWMQVGDGDVEKWWPTGTANGDGTFHYSEDKTTSMWELNGDFTADPDPYVSSTAGILNTTGSTQTYTFTIVLPIAPPLANPTLHGGSTIVTLLDANGDGTATMGQSGSIPIYMGMIDGSGVLPLLPPTGSGTVPLTVNTAGGIDVSSKVVMPPSLLSGAVTTSIAIQHTFTLSAGDQATFNSRFEVIPEPATLAILGLGSLALLGRRKRA